MKIVGNGKVLGVLGESIVKDVLKGVFLVNRGVEYYCVRGVISYQECSLVTGDHFPYDKNQLFD